MLFILNKALQSVLHDVALLAGKESFAVLMTADAAFLATEEMVEKLTSLGAEDIFVDASAATARGISLAGSVEEVDFKDMADLIMDEYEKVICL